MIAFPAIFCIFPCFLNQSLVVAFLVFHVLSCLLLPLLFSLLCNHLSNFWSHLCLIFTAVSEGFVCEEQTITSLFQILTRLFLNYFFVCLSTFIGYTIFYFKLFMGLLEPFCRSFGFQDLLLKLFNPLVFFLILAYPLGRDLLNDFFRRDSLKIFFHQFIILMRCQILHFFLSIS